MRIVNKITTRYSFNDGAKIILLHKYALRLEINNRTIDMGFERPLEPNIDRLIHEESLMQWITPGGILQVTPSERIEIIERIKQYCLAKGFTYRIVP